MTQPASKSPLANPDSRVKFKKALSDLTHHFQLIDDRKEAIKEAVAELSAEYGVEKKHIRKLAATLHKSNYNEQRQANQAFEAFYELIFEGGLRDDVDDPLDRQN